MQVTDSHTLRSHNYYYLEFAKTARSLALREKEIVSSKQSTKQDKARQAVQALLNMTPHLDKDTRKHRISLS